MLEALGNIGDFVGGIAVIATLIYLAVQVRQNTATIRRSAELEHTEAHGSVYESFSRFRVSVASNPSLAEIYYKGSADPESLTPVERLRFNLLVEELFYILQTAFRRLQTVDAPLKLSGAKDLGIDLILRSPGIRQWWSRQKVRFDPRFMEFIDAQVSG